MSEEPKLPPIGTPERDHFLQRMLSDTGFYARNVLGMDTDRDENGNATSEIGKGGVRDWGPHQQLVSFLDDDENDMCLIMAPRYSYKSSIARAFIQRKIVAHPNISILLAMHDYDQAKDRCRAIRDDLLHNPILKELFPDMKGPLWRDDRFITGLRTDRTGDTPTLYICSPKKTVTGTRPHIVIFDDIVTEEDLSDLALGRARRLIEKSLALESRGSRLINIGTPYHYGDAHHMCMEAPAWKKLTHLDVGYELVVNEDKTMRLEGEGTWPNLSKEFLERKLRGGMSFPTFMSQYKLQVVSGTHQPFHRHHFQPEPWSEKLKALTGYLLCDAAQGTPEGVTPGRGYVQCFNVLMYVGVDDRNHVHILDLEVGRWPMLEFCDRYIAMIDKWSSKVTHRVELWEQVTSSQPYAEFITVKMREAGRRPSISWQKRTAGGAKAKTSRISSTQVRFQAHEVHVCETVPRSYLDDAERKVLWDPEGFVDPLTGAKLPGGFLVEQFIRHPHTGPEMQDIADTFALIDSMDKESGQRVCFHVRPSNVALSEEVKRQPIQRKHLGSAERFFHRTRRRRA